MKSLPLIEKVKEERTLIQQAHKLRRRKLKLSNEAMYKLIFSVMTYCSQTVEPGIKAQLEKKGDRILIK